MPSLLLHGSRTEDANAAGWFRVGRNIGEVRVFGLRVSATANVVRDEALDDKLSDALFERERGSRVPSLLLVARVASHNAGNIHT